MKIAVTYENGEVFQHFGHTEQFKLYEVSGGKLLHTQVVDTNGSGHGALAGLLAQLGVDTLICGRHWRRRTGSACGGQYPSDRRCAGQCR